MSRVGFILKPEKPEARHLVEELAAWCRDNGHQTVVLAEDQVNPPGARIVPEAQLSQSIDICVVLGGDGTILRASKAVAHEGIPLLGINLGRLGFLSPFDPQEAVDALSRAANGELEIVTRMRLQVTDRPREGEVVEHTALNDVVINQGAMARLIELEAFLDDCFITSYRSDGLVISSPAGSTAYNLAAGGPIMYPGHEAIAITPICAQGLTNRPLVVPARNTVRISMSGESQGVVLTVDGQWARTFQHGDEIEVTISPWPLRIFASDSDYFNILRSKLHWGVRADN